MKRVTLPHLDTASAIALKALGFLAADSSQMQRFMALSGIDVDTLRSEADEPHILASVLDYLSQDDSLLMTFAANAGLDPGAIQPALHVLQNA